MTTENNNRELIDGLRACARFLEEHPQVDKIYDECHLILSSKPLKEVARLGLGTLEKEPWCETYFSLVKTFSSNVRIRFYEEREAVCKRVVTGQKIIPAEPEKFIPAKTLPAEPERVEDIWEWHCPDSLLKGEDEQTHIEATRANQRLLASPDPLFPVTIR